MAYDDMMQVGLLQFSFLPAHQPNCPVRHLDRSRRAARHQVDILPLQCNMRGRAHICAVRQRPDRSLWQGRHEQRRRHPQARAPQRDVQAPHARGPVAGRHVHRVFSVVIAATEADRIRRSERQLRHGPLPSHAAVPIGCEPEAQPRGRLRGAAHAAGGCSSILLHEH